MILKKEIVYIKQLLKCLMLNNDTAYNIYILRLFNIYLYILHYDNKRIYVMLIKMCIVKVACFFFPEEMNEFDLHDF